MSEAGILLRLWRYVRPHRSLLVQGLLLLAASACRLVLPLLVKTAIDEHLVPGDLAGFPGLCAAFAAVAALEFVLRRRQVWTVECAGQNALRDLRVDVFRHLMGRSARFFDRSPVGSLVGRVTTDVGALLS